MSRRHATPPSVTPAHYIYTTADSLSRTLGAQQIKLLLFFSPRVMKYL